MLSPHLWYFSMIFFVKPPQPLKKTSYQMNVHIGPKNEIFINYEGIAIIPASKP
jgi:hypothetical protein